MTKGIDYSGPGATCNRDSETGIRYGIIPADRLAHWVYDEFEAIYWRGCGHCGTEHPVGNADGEDFKECERDDDESGQLLCLSCFKTFDEDDHYGDVPFSQEYDRDGLRMRICNDNDVWVFMSPLIIKAGFCSPCAPGACHLESPCVDGAECYAVPREWFDDESPCPYPEGGVPE